MNLNLSVKTSNSASEGEPKIPQSHIFVMTSVC